MHGGVLVTIKIFLTTTLLICLMPAVCSGQESIVGHWQGALIRDDAVQVIAVDFFNEGATLKARIEVPDLVISQPSIVPANIENGRVRFETIAGMATLTNDAAMGEMIGVVGQTIPLIRIHLKRALKRVEVSVRSEDVRFSNGPVTLSGSLITPATAGRHPVVVWIHGRGKSPRNAFRGFAQLLAQRGIASLIYDKRGVGLSTGNHDTSGVNDFAGDALAAIKFVAERAEVDPKQIGIHATSAGAWAAASVANRTKIPLAFIITNVGPADSVRDQQLHVSQYSMRRSSTNFTPEEYAAAAAHMNLVEDFAYTGKGWEALRASVVKAKQTRWANFVDLPESETYEDIVWVRLNQYDPGPDLEKITTPFLAIFGGDDYVVPPEENVQKLERYLKKAGNTDFKVVVLPGADHGLTIPGQLRRIGSETPDKYYWLWRKRAPGMVETTIDWLLKHVKINPATPTK